jgi:hypothetical protein
MLYVSPLPPRDRATTIGAADPLSTGEVIWLLQTAASPDAIVHYREEGHSFLISNEHAGTLGYRPATVRESIRRFAIG